MWYNHIEPTYLIPTILQEPRNSNVAVIQLGISEMKKVSRKVG